MTADHRQELEALRPDLLRFARLQLRDAAAAEDAVQETLLAALAAADSFGSRAAYKTWLIAILRNKIVDHLRSHRREISASELAADAVDDERVAETLFDARGHWRDETQPSPWADPDASLEQKQFWAVFEACLHHLPERTARVFRMREILGLETDEICKETGISASNCWVVLHRARLGLRGCLEAEWFAGAED